MDVLKTFKLTIYRADHSVYWTEYSNNLQQLEAWLATEQTRPYWDPSYTYIIEEL